MNKLGKKIREERRKLNLTLDQLAKSTGLSKSFLSQIERNVAGASIGTIRRIARELGVSVITLFTDELETQNSFGNPPSKDAEINKCPSYVKDVRLVKANSRKNFTLPNSKISYELITPDLNRQVEIVYYSLSPGENSGETLISDPYGEKCVIVLKGALELCVDGHTYQLEKGDSLYYPANIPHSWRGIGSELVEVMLIITPPWF